MTKRKKTPGQLIADEFYAVRHSEFEFQFPSFEEVTIHCFNCMSEKDARKKLERFIAFLAEGTVPK